MVDDPLWGGEQNGAQIRHPAARALHGYWNRLRGPRQAPERREIEPADIGRILSDTFILEAIDDGTSAYRLAGTRLCAAFGRELKGENWFAAWSERDRQALATLMRTVVAEGVGARIEFDGRNPRGQYCPFETVLLPLSHRGPQYTRILGATVPLDEPYWLRIQPIVQQAVTSLRLNWPDIRAPELAAGAAADMAAIQSPTRRFRHLAVYEGGRPD